MYLALGRSKAALPDLDQVIELRPDFSKVMYDILCYFWVAFGYLMFYVGLHLWFYEYDPNSLQIL